MSDRIEKFNYTGEKSERLDKFLVTRLPEFSRARLQGLIEDGCVLVNNVPAKKSGQSVRIHHVAKHRVESRQRGGMLGIAVR